MLGFTYSISDTTREIYNSILSKPNRIGGTRENIQCSQEKLSNDCSKCVIRKRSWVWMEVLPIKTSTYPPHFKVPVLMTKFVNILAKIVVSPPFLVGLLSPMIFMTIGDFNIWQGNVGGGLVWGSIACWESDKFGKSCQCHQS